MNVGQIVYSTTIQFTGRRRNLIYLTGKVSLNKLGTKEKPIVVTRFLEKRYLLILIKDLVLRV